MFHSMGTSAEKRAKATELLTGYLDSQASCEHGEEGLLINVHPTTTARLFRESLEERAPSHPSNRFRHANKEQEWTHVKTVPMLSIHSTMLEAALTHEHTMVVEANCVVKANLPESPRAMSVDTSTPLFDGRYTWARPNCEYTIESRQSVGEVGTTRVFLAIVTMRLPGGLNAGACDGVTDKLKSVNATIFMSTERVGVIELPVLDEDGSMSVSIGRYVIDPHGLQDTIEWDEDKRLVWSKLGQAYEKNSSIGPIVDMEAGVLKRNADAWLRWNWGLDRIDTRQIDLNNEYRFGHATGEGTTLYNLDTGVAVSHDDFGGRALGGYSAGCADGTELTCLDRWIYRGIVDDGVMARTKSNGKIVGCSEHGTHTSSTAVGTKYGVASGAKLVAVQVLSCDGVGSDATILAGLDWSINHALAQRPWRPSVASLSLGGDFDFGNAFRHAVDQIMAQGMLIVVAAGNDAGDSCAESPADIAEAVTVGASELIQPQLEGGHLLELPSNESAPRYDVPANYSDHGSCVDLFAPGSQILAAVPTYGSTHTTGILSGTSMATPFVAGIALQILGLFPSFRPDDVTRALLCLAVDDALRTVDPHTPNRLAQGGAQMTEEPMYSLLANQQEFPDVWHYDMGPASTSRLSAEECYRGPPRFPTMASINASAPIALSAENPSNATFDTALPAMSVHFPELGQATHSGREGSLLEPEPMHFPELGRELGSGGEGLFTGETEPIFGLAIAETALQPTHD